MSSTVDFNEPLSSMMNHHNGFKLEDFEGLKEFSGTSGNDLLYGTDESELINGAAGSDYIDGQGGDDLISGGDDIDYILGGAGDDLLSGDNGNDLINGGAGSDQLSGGEGNDTFLFEFFDDGVDTVTDFKVGEDIIQIQGVGSEATVDYNQNTGSLSVNGEEIAKLNVGLDGWSDDSYEVF